MKLHWVEQMDDVLKIALEGPLPELKEETPPALVGAVPPPTLIPEQRPHQ
jgi:ATP-dependent Lon protease